MLISHSSLLLGKWNLCETSTLKVQVLSAHLFSIFTCTFSNCCTSSLSADLFVFPRLICDSGRFKSFTTASFRFHLTEAPLAFSYTITRLLGVFGIFSVRVRHCAQTDKRGPDDSGPLE